MRQEAPRSESRQAGTRVAQTRQSQSQIDRHTPVPLYFQIAEQLRNEIRKGRMGPGALLTTDERIQQEFGVSRATARKAIDELVDEALVERITGKGTFLIEPRLQVPLPAMLSFTEELERRGMHPRNRVLSVGWSSATERIAHALEIPMGSRVLQLERIRHAGQKPVLYTVDILPGNLGIGPERDFSGSLYRLIETTGLQLHSSQNIIEAAVTDVRLGELLQVGKGFPVLALRRTSYDRKGCPVLYEDAACRGDLFSYAVRMVRQRRTSARRK